MRTALALRAVLGAAVGITVVPVVAAPAVAQQPVGSADVAASLLRLEDRREYDASVLEPASRDASPDVRRRAVVAAGRIGDRRGVPLAVRLLADRDTSVAASAAFALGLLRDTTAVDALVRELRAADVVRRATVIGEAAFALSRMPTPDGKRAVEGLLGTLVDTAGRSSFGDPRSRLAVRSVVGNALLALWRFPRPLNTAVVERWLASPDTALRWRAAYALSRRPDPKGTAVLARAVNDPLPLVRSFALRAFTAALADSAGIPRDSAVRVLLRGSGDPNHMVSVNAARSLGSYDAPQSITRLNVLVNAGDPYLAVTAAEALGQLGTRASVGAAALRAAALDTRRSPALRAAALTALASIDQSATLALADSFMAQRPWRLRAAAARVIARISARTERGTTPPSSRIVGLIRDRDGRIAAAAVDGLLAGADSAVRVRPYLLLALASPDFATRASAIGGLAQIANPADVPALLDAYARADRDSVNDVLLAAIDALGAIAKKERSVASAFLSRFRRPADYLVRRRAAVAFGDSVVGEAWGATLPIETNRSMDDYRRLVRDAASQPRPRARIVTNLGTIELELFASDAPMTVESFLTLARRRFFDGQEWPRVVPNFVTQGGDPRGDTNGGPGFAIRDEVNRHLYLTGTLGMALSGPETGGSQWFITHSPQPHLDGTYTVFGRAISGMDVVTRLLPGDRIVRIEPIVEGRR